jgi:hypothetical protein
VILVHEQRKWERVLLLELLVGRLIVGRDAQHHRTRGADAGPAVTKLAGLDRAAAGVVLGVEVEHHFLPPEARQTDCFTAVGRERKRGSLVAWFQHDGNVRDAV